MKVKLGGMALDRITGFSGTVIAETQYLHGEKHFGVQSGELKNGIPTEMQWFDERRLDDPFADVDPLANVAVRIEKAQGWRPPLGGFTGPGPKPLLATTFELERVTTNYVGLGDSVETVLLKRNGVGQDGISGDIVLNMSSKDAQLIRGDVHHYRVAIYAEETKR
jgi:hypothetical protein